MPEISIIIPTINEANNLPLLLSDLSTVHKEEEILIVKKKLSKKINLNKLNTNQKIQFTINQSNNQLKEFIFQISNAEKIYLTKNK